MSTEEFDAIERELTNLVAGGYQLEAARLARQLDQVKSVVNDKRATAEECIEWLRDYLRD